MAFSGMTGTAAESNRSNILILRGNDMARAFRQATRMGDWKAVRYGHKGKTQLYNLANDLHETTDLAGDYPEIVEQMENILRKESVKTEHFPHAGGPVK